MPLYRLNSATLGATPAPTWFAFARGVESIDPQGDAVSSAMPRFRRSRAIGGLWGAPSEIVSASSTNNSRILAAGLDLDNSHAVLVILNDATSTLSVVRDTGTGFSTESSTTLPNVQSVGSHISANGRDIRGGTTYDNVTYEPIVGTVVFRTIVVLCRAATFNDISLTWDYTGVAIFYSTDYGANFVKYYDDLDDPMDLKKNRGQSWSMQSWFAPWHNGSLGHRPLEAVVTFSDYRHAPTDETVLGQLPGGGRAFFFKLKQASENSSTYPFIPVSSGSPAVPAVGIVEMSGTQFLDSDHPRLIHNPPAADVNHSQVN